MRPFMTLSKSQLKSRLTVLSYCFIFEVTSKKNAPSMLGGWSIQPLMALSKSQLKSELTVLSYCFKFKVT